MSEDEIKTNLLLALKAAKEAGEAILEIYDKGFEVYEKEDKSPLTDADNKAHEIISAFLEKTTIPVLSEEGRSIEFVERKNWIQLWIVDPLDGTKEFIKRNGEYTVNIALIENNKPILGVIYVPVQNKMSTLR